MKKKKEEITNYNLPNYMPFDSPLNKPETFPENAPSNIITLKDGTRINTFTNMSETPTGFDSPIQDARAQDQNLNTGIINIGSGAENAPINNQPVIQPINPAIQSSGPQQIMQPEAQQRGLIERVSDLALQPAEIAANLIFRGANLLAGKEIPKWENTSAELAQTTGGKILGTATAGAGLALGGLLGAQALGAGAAGETITMASRLKGLIGANIAKNGLLSKVVHSTTLKLVVGGSVVALPWKMVNDAKSAITGSVQTADLINDSVKAGLIPPDEALTQYELLSQQIISLESGVSAWSHLNIINFLGGGKDTLIDIQNAKINLELKKQTLINMLMGVR